jgi:hypothetical protein
MAREEGFFDELARGLADGTLTRGKALRLMGAALVGGTLASLGIGEAGADPPGCKRAGKHCTRTDQCCGSLVCLSGTCQTPTTTTTETPTTTTTETPTTTTTPMCIPNNTGTCTSSNQCCGGAFCAITGYCIGQNIVDCTCESGGPVGNCSSIDCSDATALNQFCTDQCASLFGLALGSVQCTPNGCLPR